MSVAGKMIAFLERSSWIRQMFEAGSRLKAEIGAENVFDFSLGNPNLDPPPLFRSVLESLVIQDTEGAHAYMPNAGYAATREAVAGYLRQIHGAPFEGKHVIMTCGAAGALNIALKAILNPGDEVLVFRPFFVEYTFYVDNHGGTAVTVPSRSDFSMDMEALETSISKKTAAVLINSPNNPTGKVYSKSELDVLGSLLERKSRETGRTLYLVSDEPYRKIVYDGLEVPSPFQSYRHSLLATSYSKDLSLPGERIGYLAVHPEAEDASLLLDAAILANRILGFVNAPALMQRVIQYLQGASVDVTAYQRKRDTLCAGLSEAGYTFHKPEGAFYLFPHSPIPDDVAFVRELQKHNILAVPGTGFGGPGHFRLSYCVDDGTIKRSLTHFKEALKPYR